MSAEQLNYSGLGLTKKTHRLNKFLRNLCSTCFFGCLFDVNFNAILFFHHKIFNLNKKLIKKLIQIKTKYLKKQNKNKIILK